MLGANLDESEVGQVLLAMVENHASDGAVLWFKKGLPKLNAPLSRGRFFGTYAGCGRRMKDAGSLNASEISALRRWGVEASSAYCLADIARAVLLLRAMTLIAADERAPLFKESLQKGEPGEQISSLRALSLLPEPSLYLEAAIDAARTNITQVFEALAIGNRYPTLHFPELNFNQLVMKALFMGLAARDIYQLASRVTPELVRMARDYASERRAANRSVPEDVAFIEAALR